MRGSTVFPTRGQRRLNDSKYEGNPALYISDLAHALHSYLMRGHTYDQNFLVS